MTEDCCSRPAAGSIVCELPSATVNRPARSTAECPSCREKGKPVQGQTVKALLAVSLRQVRNVEYMFCSTQSCRVAYFSTDGQQMFTVDQVRERIYQKEPDADDVLVCYCFRHTVGEVRQASSVARAGILDDINTGIQSDQCACDLRNPQGSCCLGNVRDLIKKLAVPVLS